jgi:hypothetical protein
LTLNVAALQQGRQASLVVDPPDGRLPATTLEGQTRAKAMRSTYYYDFPDLVEAHPFEQFADLGPYDRCITRGVLPSMLPTGYNMGTQIFQAPGVVAIRIEMIHETRIIRSTIARTWLRGSEPTWGTRAVVGRAIRWSWRRRT